MAGASFMLATLRIHEHPFQVDTQWAPKGSGGADGLQQGNDDCYFIYSFQHWRVDDAGVKKYRTVAMAHE